MEIQSRRHFLQRLGALLALAWGTRWGVAKASAGWFSGVEKDPWLSIGKLENLPDGKGTVVEKAIRVVGGKVVNKPKLLAIRRGDEVRVISTKCTHLGCEVGLQADGTYLCPCHAATFDAKGAATKGPAKDPLPWYETKVAADGDVQVNPDVEVPAPSDS